MDEGWKGRAQQIVLLKSKVARLEKERDREGQGQQGAGAGAKGRFKGSSSSYAARGVDAKAEEELSSMSQERQQAVEVGTPFYVPPLYAFPSFPSCVW